MALIALESVEEKSCITDKLVKSTKTKEEIRHCLLMNDSQLRFGKSLELRGGWEGPITATRVPGAGATKTTAFIPSIGQLRLLETPSRTTGIMKNTAQ